MKMKLTPSNWAATCACIAAVNLGIIALVGAAIYWLHSAWPLIGLIFFMHTKTVKIDTECPKCGNKFVAVEKDDADD